MKFYLFSLLIAFLLTLIFSFVSLLFSGKKTTKIEEFIIRTKDEFFRIDVNTIMYAEDASDSVLYHLSDKEEALVCPQTFEDAKYKLKKYPHFISPNDSYIVNTYHISNILNSDPPQIVMFNGDTLPMPREKYCATADALLKYGTGRA